jgi:hypothetical protein
LLLGLRADIDAVGHTHIHTTPKRERERVSCEPLELRPRAGVVQGDVLVRIKLGTLVFSGVASPALRPMSCRKKEFDAAGCDGTCAQE